MLSLFDHPYIYFKRIFYLLVIVSVESISVGVYICLIDQLTDTKLSPTSYSLWANTLSIICDDFIQLKVFMWVYLIEWSDYRCQMVSNYVPCIRQLWPFIIPLNCYVFAAYSQYGFWKEMLVKSSKDRVVRRCTCVPSYLLLLQSS